MSSSDDDDLWVRPRPPVPPPPALTPLPATAPPPAPAQPPARTDGLHRLLAPAPTPARSNGLHRALPAPSATRLNSVQQHPRPVIPKRATTRERVCAPEAEEDNASSSGSECAESGEDAQSLYRSAILGVRNANHARQQVRAATVNCPVCAKLAAVLEHFL